ncbi:unnamed protein product [Trichogramma brassicae]|uniref:Uncharacterized protein n=1 Tax=Trichogramma brassicae TaxID=86971 RepID=A0A6H5IW03_9HYME|nr:unnamed protein product [Trichogramma brassicae]
MPAMCDHAADGSGKGDTTIDDGIVQDRSDTLCGQVKSCQVSGVYSGSDQQAMAFEVHSSRNRRSFVVRRRWSARTLNSDCFA